MVTAKQQLREDKLAKLCEIEGFADLSEFLEVYGLECVVPGICVVHGCDYTTNVEPDQRHGWCECCDAKTVQSGLVLAEVI